MKPLSAGRRLIVPSLRHYFPEHWDGKGDKFTMIQHVEDVIAFIQGLGVGSVDLIGHSRGGHLAFRLALKRPDLVDRLVLAEPGGTLDESLLPAGEEDGLPAAVQKERVKERVEDGHLRTMGVDATSACGAGCG